MTWFGQSNRDYQFEMFSASHFVILAILLLVSIGLFLFRNKLKERNWRKTEIGIAISLIFMEGSYHYWMIVNGTWDVSHAIPLELCSISLMLTILLLLTEKLLIIP